MILSFELDILALFSCHALWFGFLSSESTTLTLRGVSYTLRVKFRVFYEVDLMILGTFCRTLKVILTRSHSQAASYHYAHKQNLSLSFPSHTSVTL